MSNPFINGMLTLIAFVAWVSVFVGNNWYSLPCAMVLTSITACSILCFKERSKNDDSSI